MFSAKKLTDSQISTIKQWAADGSQLSDIQKQMEEEMEIKLTYMDVRFLVLDLEVTIRNIEEEEAAKKAEEEALLPEEAPEVELDKGHEELTVDDLEILPPATANNSVTVTLDTIAKPGLMASGRVTFSDGNGGSWYIDDRGLGIDPDDINYQPERSDVEAFQLELQRLMDSQ